MLSRNTARTEKQMVGQKINVFTMLVFNNIRVLKLVLELRIIRNIDERPSKVLMESPHSV